MCRNSLCSNLDSATTANDIDAVKEGVGVKRDILTLPFSFFYDSMYLYGQ